MIGGQPDEACGEASLPGNDITKEAESRVRSARPSVKRPSLTGGADPCALARAAPPWLAERDLISMDIPISVTDALKRVCIEKVSDLADVTVSQLPDIPKSRKKSLSAIVRALEQALARAPLEGEKAAPAGGQRTLFEEIKSSVRLLSPLKSDIFTRRLGLETPVEKEQQIAGGTGVTKGDVSAIASRLFKIWVPKCSWHSSFKQKLKWIHAGRSQALRFSDMEAIDSWFEGMVDNQEFFRRFIQASLRGEFNVVVIDGSHCVCQITQTAWGQAVEDASRLLRSAPGQGWTEDYARYKVQCLLPENARELGGLLWEKFSGSCIFARADGGERILVSNVHGLDKLVRRLLANSDSPLHYTKIQERLSRDLDTQFEPKAVRGAASRVGLLLSNGTYGAARHIPFSEEWMDLVRSKAEQVVCSESLDRRWRISEILSEMAKFPGDDFQRLDLYILKIALSKSSLLGRLKNGAWVHVESQVEKLKRVNCLEAIASILKKAGEPLSSSEIKRRLAEEAGIENIAEIDNKPPLARIDVGVYGIRARDYPLSNHMHARLVEQVILILEKRQSGLHLGDLPNEFPEATASNCPPYAFFAQAAQDDRLQIAWNRYLYLAKWKNPRRESLVDSLRAVLKGVSGPFSISEITTLLGKHLKRSCSKRIVRGGLNTLGAQYDDKTQTWSFKGDQSSTTNKGKNLKVA